VQWKEKKVKLVLLLALKEERDNSFEQLFEELVQMLSDASQVKKLAKQTSFRDFMELCPN
jgi:mannitol/fructose-specific phosphotransferase system IIA component (Ntr-type)